MMIRIPQFAFRRLAKFLIDYPHITQRLYERAQRTPYSHISGRDGQGEYMRRYWLFNPYQNADGSYPKRNWFMRMLPSIRFHEILRPDDDEHGHDHPWDAQTIVLRGWYIEEVENPAFDPKSERGPGNPERLAFVRETGYTGPIRFGEYHRIATVSQKRRQQTLTLFFTFKYCGEWGFKVDGVKVPWREYLAARQAVTKSAQKVSSAKGGFTTDFLRRCEAVVPNKGDGGEKYSYATIVPATLHPSSFMDADDPLSLHPKSDET